MKTIAIAGRRDAAARTFAGEFRRLYDRGRAVAATEVAELWTAEVVDRTFVELMQLDRACAPTPGTPADVQFFTLLRRNMAGFIREAAPSAGETGVPVIPAALAEEQDAHVADAVGLGRRELPRERARAVRERMKTDELYRAVVKPIVEAYRKPALSEEDMEIAWARFVRKAGLPTEAEHAVIGDWDWIDRRRVMRVLRGIGRALVGAMIVWGAVWAFIGVMQLWYFDRARTDANETLVRTLPDNSVARMGPESWLKHREGMRSVTGRPARDTWMTGDIRFEVQPVERPPFEVTTEQAELTVLGTRFRVVARQGVTTVEMERGRIVIRRRDWKGDFEGKRQVVKEGQVARITHEQIVIGEMP